MARRLTSRQIMFIHYIVLGNSGACSARLAGYATESARKTAYRLLNTPLVLRYFIWCVKRWETCLNGLPMIPPKYDLIKDLVFLGVRKIGVEPITEYIDLSKNEGNLTESVIDFNLIRAEDKEHAKAKRHGFVYHGKRYYLQGKTYYR